MRRWWFIWWVPLVGVALATGAGVSGAALAMAGHGLAVAPCVVTMVISFGCAVVDILPESWGYERRQRIDPRPCSDCRCINTVHASTVRQLAAVTKDRDELREAIVVLSIPARTPGDTSEKGGG